MNMKEFTLPKLFRNYRSLFFLPLLCLTFYFLLAIVAFERVSIILPTVTVLSQYQLFYVENSSLSDLGRSSHSIKHLHEEYNASSSPGLTHNQSMDVCRYKIAIGGGITSANLKNITADNMAEKFPFFSSLLPSFCKTMSTSFCHHFYFAYDHTDLVFITGSLLEAFHHHFIRLTSELCPKNNNNEVTLHMIKCNYSKHPAWAQNDAMMEAYLDGMDYFYRVNDDTIMMTGNWANVFIEILSSLEPPNVGVVGPRHSGDLRGILTYDFVHMTHVDIFGFYYPRVFTDWFADTWITKVYPSRLMKEVSAVNVKHTRRLGKRYPVHHGNKAYLSNQIQTGQSLIKRYIKVHDAKRLPQNNNGWKKIIAFSLFSMDQKHIRGAIRNVQLAKVVFPGWIPRIYTSALDNLNIPYRILATLERLGAKVVLVNKTDIPPCRWNYLVMDDDDVEAFIIRNVEFRLTERDHTAVSDWIQSAEPFHCIRDHPKHAPYAIVDGLWGVRPKLLKPAFNISSISNLLHFKDNTINNQQFLDDTLWPLVKHHAYCHDSMYCNKWPSSHQFPAARIDNEYLSEEFDMHEKSVSMDNTLATMMDLLCAQMDRNRIEKQK